MLDEETPNTSNGVGTLNSELEGYPLAKELIEAPFTGVDDSSNLVAMTPTNSISVAKLLQNVDRSYDNGKKFLEESKLDDARTV